MSAAFGLKVRTVMSLRVSPEILTRAGGEAGERGNPQAPAAAQHPGYGRAGMPVHMNARKGYRPLTRRSKRAAGSARIRPGPAGMAGENGHPDESGGRQ